MKEYITSILYMTIVTALVNQILPSERYRKLIGTVCGFLLLLVFFHPLLTGSLEQELRQRYQVLVDSLEDSLTFDMDSRERLTLENKRIEVELVLRQLTGEETLQVRLWGKERDGEYQIAKLEVKGLHQREKYQQLIAETVTALYGEETVITYR